MAQTNSAAKKTGPAPQAKRPTPALLVLERTAGIQLNNRFIWLLAAVTMYLILQLSYIQWQTATQLGNPRFDTMDLVAILQAICEACLLICALVLVIATPRIREAWYRKYPTEKFSYIATGFGGILALILLQAILLAPILFLHRYPELAAEGIRVPLMIMQRVVLVNCLLLASYNLMLVLRHVLRFPWWLAGILGALTHIGTGYYLTFLSNRYEALIRLNDVFIYNLLWQHFDKVPNLSTGEIFHNIQMPHLAYYLGTGSIIALFTLILWLPRASTLSARESLPESAE